jgi:hypothetical protein
LAIKHYLSLSLLIFGISAAAMALSSAIFLLKNTQVAGQIGIEPTNQDTFKIILTIDRLTKQSGDVITFVTVDGQSKAKLHDDQTSYFNAIDSDGHGFIEYISTFPNMTIKAGEQFKACALFMKDSNLVCKTGYNSPALRPEVVEMSFDQQGT